MADITLMKAVDLCRAEEITAKRSQEFGVPVPGTEINKVFKKKKSVKTQKCKFCGDSHEFVKGVCPAFGKNVFVARARTILKKCVALDRNRKTENRSVKSWK